MRPRSARKVVTQQADRGDEPEHVHVPVDLGAGRHVAEEEHDQDQHRDVAEHEDDVQDPGTLLVALAQAPLREEVRRAACRPSGRSRLQSKCSPCLARR